MTDELQLTITSVVHRAPEWIRHDLLAKYTARDNMLSRRSPPWLRPPSGPMPQPRVAVLSNRSRRLSPGQIKTSARASSSHVPISGYQNRDPDPHAHPSPYRTL